MAKTPKLDLPPAPDQGQIYQNAFDAIGQAYWDTLDPANKDLIHGTQLAMGEIITAYNQKQLATNTDLYIQLLPKIKLINAQLKEIQEKIAQITKNISTIATVTEAITKVLTLIPIA